MVQDIIGVECGDCGEEAFQLVPREVTKVMGVCPRCARRIDAALKEQTEAEMLKSLSKAERLLVKKERSRDWAHSWHGKRVNVMHTEIDYGCGLDKPKTRISQIRGMAYFHSKHEDIGYGRVKVVLDNAELKRIIYIKDERQAARCNKIPTVDGERFGMSSHLITHGCYLDDPKFKLEEPIAICINWGERNELIIEEVNEAAERLKAQCEEERLQIERDKEIAKHIGEGI
jgi:hypothetical protein